MSRKPNFLVICTDQQRSDSLGCAGNAEARTPYIDAIGEGGLRFTRHSTPMQICSPSRATMLTGLYPRHHRLVVNGMALPADVPVVTETLSRNGYRTHGVGKQHLQPILAPSEYAMPDSRAFWDTPESVDWVGPFYGYQTVDLLLGESDTAHLAGHYARWLSRHHPESVKKLLPESAPEAPPVDLDEVWCSPIPTEHHYNSWIADRAIRFIEQGRENEAPFFLFVSFPDPHHPFDPPLPYATAFQSAAMPLPAITDDERRRQLGYYGELYPKGEGFRELYWAGRADLEAGSMITTESISDETMRRAIAYTHAMNHMIDDQVGRILGALQRTGQRDDTVLIFTSDHGELLGDHGLLHKGPPPYRQLTEVSLLVQGPGIQAGGTVQALTNHIDLAPTILEIAGVDASEHRFDGASLLPLLQGGNGSIRDYDFGEYHPTARKDLYNQTVRTRQWRLTLYPDHPDWGELFSLDEDPGERLNRFGEAGFENITTELSTILATRFPPRETVDNTWICKW